MMSMANVEQEEDFEAESDARTMMEMSKIMGDEKRHKKAQSKMDEMMKGMEMMKNLGMNYKSMGDTKK